MNDNKSAVEFDIFDIILFFWNSKLQLITFSILGLIIGFLAQLNVSKIYENKQMIYFNDYRIPLISDKLNINLINYFLNISLENSKQVNFLINEFNLSENDALSAANSFIIENDLVKNYVRIVFINSKENFSDKKISLLYSKYISELVNNNIQSAILDNLDSLESELAVSNETNFTKDLEIYKIKKQVYEKNLKIANSLGLEDLSDHLNIVDASNAFVNNREILAGYEDRLFLFGSTVLDSLISNIEEEMKTLSVQDQMNKSEIIMKIKQSLANERAFYENFDIDPDDVSLIQVSNFDNSKKVRNPSKYYPIMGLLFGIFFGTLYILISAGLKKKLSNQ
tara:strand:- start:245 stop:1261 length:1017 start_codon:yes stop_codon:yes gene_type:complete